MWQECLGILVPTRSDIVCITCSCPETCGCTVGEYAMLKAAAERGWLNERDAVLEALLSLRRAGSDLILTYYATQAAKWMAGEH